MVPPGNIANENEQRKQRTVMSPCCFSRCPGLCHDLTNQRDRSNLAPGHILPHLDWNLKSLRFYWKTVEWEKVMVSPCPDKKLPATFLQSFGPEMQKCMPSFWCSSWSFSPAQGISTYLGWLKRFFSGNYCKSRFPDLPLQTTTPSVAYAIVDPSWSTMFWVFNELVDKSLSNSCRETMPLLSTSALSGWNTAQLACTKTRNVVHHLEPSWNHPESLFSVLYRSMLHPTRDCRGLSEELHKNFGDHRLAFLLRTMLSLDIKKL